MGVLEENQRLSESILWELQHCAYTQFGPDAWAEKGVPFYLTSNPLTAKKFSAVLLAYMRDILSELDLSQPVYIFDLGAGSGRLGYLILKHLLPDIKETLSKELRICYVMTDMVEENLAYWKEHTYLKQYIDSGNLDYALYHHTTNTPIQLHHSGKTLIPDSVVNPIALVATYYFDTVPQDYFRANHGQLEEGRISLSVTNQNQVDLDNLDPELIMNLESSYTYSPIDHPENYYSDRKEWNEILCEYRARFERVNFLFPSGGLESLRYFEELSKNRLLLLAGDQGVVTDEQTQNWGEPDVFKHASFSMAVSYDVLARYFEKRGGSGYLTRYPHIKFVVMSGVLGGKEFVYTPAAFQENIDAFEPVDYWKLTNFTLEVLDRLTLEQALLYVKFGNWDPMLFMSYFSEIQNKIPRATENEKKILRETIHQVWENFYPISAREADFVMNLGVLLFQINQYEEALSFFQRAKSIGGENELLNRNIAHCKRLIGD